MFILQVDFIIISAEYLARCIKFPECNRAGVSKAGPWRGNQGQKRRSMIVMLNTKNAMKAMPDKTYFTTAMTDTTHV